MPVPPSKASPSAAKTWKRFCNFIQNARTVVRAFLLQKPRPRCGGGRTQFAPTNATSEFLLVGAICDRPRVPLREPISLPPSQRGPLGRVPQITYLPLPPSPRGVAPQVPGGVMRMEGENSPSFAVVQQPPPRGGLWGGCRRLRPYNKNRPGLWRVYHSPGCSIAPQLREDI